MDKKKVLKAGVIIVEAIVFLFLFVQINEALDNRRVRLEIEEERKERQEKKDAKRIAEEYMDSFASNLQSQVHSSILKDIKVSYETMSHDEFKDKFGEQDENADYNFYYKITYFSASIDQVYSQMKETGAMSEFLASLRTMGDKKDSVFNETYEYETKINEKSIKIWYIDDAYFGELPVAGESGSTYLCSDDFWDDERYLYIDGTKVYSEERNTGKDNQTTANNKSHSSFSSNSSSGSHSRKSSDPYDAEDYDDPDDFAEEWAEEFGDGNYDDGYDDAYDYWESEHD